MHPKVADYLSRSQSRAAGQGIRFYELEVSRALDLAGQEPDLLAHLEADYEFREVSRVDFTKNIHWIDVLIVLGKLGREDKNIIVTFDSKEDSLIAVTDVRHRMNTFNDDTASLPFALSVESHTVDTAVPEEETRGLNSRRDAFQAMIVSALLPFMGLISPAQAASTSSQTCPDTGKKRSVNRPKNTSGVTTPNDNDTKSDDNYVEESYTEKDCTTDTKDD